MTDQVAAPTAPVEAGNTTTPEVANPPPSAPKSSEDYIQAAMKEAFIEEGIVKPETKAEAPKEEAPKEEAKPPEANPLAMSFEKLAKEKAELRKVAEQVKPYQELLKGFDPNTLQAIARAKASGDPVSALAALGFTHNDYVQSVVGKDGKASKEPERKPVEKDPEIQSLKSELEQVKQWRAQKVREEMSQSVKSIVTSDKYRHIAGLEAHDAVVNFLNDYYARTGEAPGETWSDSVKIAADEVEKYLAQEANRWRKVVLTDTPKPATQSVGTEKPTAEAVKPAKSLNNSMVSPAVNKPTPKTQEDYIQAALEAIE